MKPEKPERMPQIRVTQVQPLPVQPYEGAPVTGELHVEVIRPSYPPYDYAWRPDGAAVTSGPQHTPRFKVTKIPPPNGAPGAREVLTTVQVSVIDMFGQVTQTSAQVRFQRAQRQQSPHPPQQSPRSHQPAPRPIAIPQPTPLPLPPPMPVAPPAPQRARRSSPPPPPRRVAYTPRRRGSFLGCIGRMLVLPIVIAIVFAGAYVLSRHGEIGAPPGPSAPFDEPPTATPFIPPTPTSVPVIR